jgi:hypothetical protein
LKALDDATMMSGEVRGVKALTMPVAGAGADGLVAGPGLNALAIESPRGVAGGAGGCGAGGLGGRWTSGTVTIGTGM